MKNPAIDQAHDFLNLLNPKIPPHFSVADDGEACFYWAYKTFMIDLGFCGDGTYSYYAKLENGKEFFEDEASIDTPLPIELVELVEGSINHDGQSVRDRAKDITQQLADISYVATGKSRPARTARNSR